MGLRITVIVENSPLTASSGVRGEHGLSLLVQADGRTVLFDTGASTLVGRNADALGLGETISRVDAVVLSHGHYDHTGGLVEVLERLAKPTPVHAGPGFFARRVHRSASGLRDIGVPGPRAQFEKLGARFEEGAVSREILPGIVLTGPIERREDTQNQEEALCVQLSDGAVETDSFGDEQAMAVRTERGIVVLVGCAHRGLMNSIAAAREAAGEERVRAIFGGAHLRSAGRQDIARVAGAVAELDPELVALGHCTGEEAETRFAEVLGSRFESLRAGASWAFE